MSATLRKILVISTGGTIEKTYCAHDGSLRNAGSVLDLLLGTLETSALEIERLALFDKDSLDMTEQDHALIVETVLDHALDCDGIIVVHGTDKLSVSGERIYDLLTDPLVPIVLTGAMRPYVMRNTDAVQNLTEALLAVQLLAPGVYLAMHNRVLQFPGVLKDRQHGTFAKP